jgi:hypothetical protein
MKSVYRRLLWLYPAEHREQFGEEMFGVFQDVRSEIASAGALTRGAFLAREFGGLLSGALHEHLRGLGIFDAGVLLSARRFNMRNGFRFPKSTAVLMTVILLGVIVAIRKGEAIAYSLPQVSEPVGPIHPVHSGLLPPIPVFFLCFYAAGVIGWAILFAMRRSGMHRLADISGERK